MFWNDVGTYYLPLVSKVKATHDLIVTYHFAGWFEGVDQRSKYPKGADPYVLGESVNTITTYGYDPVTGMQEPKATLCQIRAA